MNVFDLFAKISLDTSAYESALNGAKGMASCFGSTLTNVVGQAVDFVKTSLETAGRATAAFIGDSIQTGREFDQAMSQVAATMGTSVGEIENLRDFAREMGASTAFSATEAAEALNYMALAGYDAETSMSMLPNVLNLAAAGNIGLARASDMVTDTQTAFGISLERTTQMVDEMAKAASTGNTNVEQLGDAFLTVGGLAQELNGGFVTLEDGTQAEVDGLQELEIALTSMANAGVKGSEAGTHMRNMLLKLTSPTAEGAEQFERLGVKVFDAGGKMRSLKDIFGDLNTSLGRLTQQEKLQAVSELFNARDTASAEALLNAIGEDWDHIGESILDAKGAAEEMAETQLDNLEGDITKFKSALDEAKISISDRLAPTLRDFVQTGTRELGHLAEAFQGNGFRGLFTVIRLDIEQAQRHITEALPELKQKGEQLVGKIAEGIENNASVVGEKAAGLLTKIGTKLTDTDAFDQIFGFAKTVFDNFVSGLLSDESLAKLSDPETGVPKIIENIGENLKTAAEGLMDSASKIIERLGDFLNDEENREKLKKSAEKAVKTFAKNFASKDSWESVAGIIVEASKLLADIFIGGVDWNATGKDIAGQIVRGFYNNLLTTKLGTFIGESLEEGVNASEHRDLDAPVPAYITYSRTQDMIEDHTMPDAAYQAYLRARGYYASGFDAQRPAYLTNTVVGEAGEEVLLPLDSNTAWMDKLAEKLGERMGGGSVVIQFGDINVNGTENVGREVVEQIDTALRQYQIMQQRGVGGTGWA